MYVKNQERGGGSKLEHVQYLGQKRRVMTYKIQDMETCKCS
jgi:hypothetical protein